MLQLPFFRVAFQRLPLNRLFLPKLIKLRGILEFS